MNATNNPYAVTPPDKTLSVEGVAADSKAVGEAVKNKADKSNSVYCNDRGVAKSYMISIPNTGEGHKTMKITLTDTEQSVFIIASASLDACFVSFVGGGNFHNKHLLNTITTSTDGNVVTVTIPSWFRGTLISYLPFSVEI